MVYPKPGLKYRYMFKLPDHVQRTYKQRNRNHGKIYEHLSDRDLEDISYKGLQRSDMQEQARFDKEKELNERMAANNNKTTSWGLWGTKSGSNRTNASRVKRVRLMPTSTSPIVKGRQHSKDATRTEVNEVKKDDATAQVQVEQKEARDSPDINFLPYYESIKASASSSKRKGGKKASNRGRKRKAVEPKVRIIEEAETETITVPIVQVIARDDSSKENENEGQSQENVSEFFSLSDRLKGEPLGLMPCEDAFWQWQVCVTKVAVKSPTPTPIPRSPISLAKRCPILAKRLTSGDDHKSEKEPTIERMDNTKIKIKLSGLKDYVNSMWTPEKNTKDNCQEDSSESEEPLADLPTLLGPYMISTPRVVRKPRGPYKKRKPKPAPKPEKPPKILKKPRLNRVGRELSTTQIMRKLRYVLERHFAKMPGTAYRLPNMYERCHTSADEDPVSGNIWLCLVCHKEEYDEKGDIMICCDHCEDWYHLRCVGVADEKYPENMKWYCKRCMVKEITDGTFHVKNFPLCTTSTTSTT